MISQSLAYSIIPCRMEAEPFVLLTDFYQSLCKVRRTGALDLRTRVC